jgi:hypothetical protein
MKDRDYAEFTSPCGIDCFNCELFEENAQSPARLALNERMPKLAGILCKGCRRQNCAMLAEPCASRRCAEERQVEFCHQCPDFPCTKLAPMAEQAARVPHNLKVFNLCRMKAVGVESWAKNESRAIRDRYFKGHFQIGTGPQME